MAEIKLINPSDYKKYFDWGVRIFEAWNVDRRAINLFENLSNPSDMRLR